MDFYVKLSIYCISAIIDVVSASRLTALNHSKHALQLYRELNNQDAPSENDLTTSEIRFRKRLCRDIADSGFFHSLDLVPVDMRRLYRFLNRSHRCSISQFLYRSANSYKKRQFRVASTCFFEEYVFVCPFKNTFNFVRNIIPYFVSKEYNMGAQGGPYMPGRFIFGNLMTENPTSFYYVILAEEPAIAHMTPTFNVELHYLQMRKYINPTEINEIDPLCKLVSENVLDPQNQHYRLCVAVSRSSYFKDSIRYPGRAPTYPCSRLKISFHTTEGMATAGEKSYYERMTRCYAQPADLSSDEGRESSIRLYISRAYISNQVFVYYGDPSDNSKVYLKNLSINISIADELNSFDFVED